MLPNPYPGRFITFEGLDGSGLTTQAEKLAKWIKGELDVPVELTKEPTDGPAGAQIRMALEGRLQIDEQTLALLFAADRMDHLQRLIIPRLRVGVHVVCDRYYLSSFAYQSVKIPELEWLFSINSKFIQPDVTILLHVSPSLCVSRMSKERFGVARYELLPELEKVWAGYERVYPLLRTQRERIELIEAPGNLSVEAVHKDVLKHCRDIFRNGRSLRKAPPEEQASLIT